MKKYITLSLLMAFLLILSQGPIFAQTALDVLNKFIEAQGGRKTLEGIKDTTVTGDMELVQMGLSGPMTMYQMEPNKMRMDFDVMGMIITQAYDGETAWMFNPSTGTNEEMPEAYAAEMKRQAMGNDSLLNPEKYGISYELKPNEKIEEKEYIVLVQTFTDGNKNTLYLDPSTYLVYKTVTTTLNQMGVEVLAETYLSDYTKVDGTVVPYSLTVYQDGEEFMRMTISKTSYNTGLEESLFKMSK